VKSSRVLRTTFAALLAATPLAAAAGAPLPQAKLHVGAHIFKVEVATNPAQRAQGLMGRTLLADDAGMLFVFEAAGRRCFWMKDTPLPLSIAFLADDGSVVNIADMAPQTTDLHCAAAPVRYALEVQQGRFRDKGIQPGMRLSGGTFRPPPNSARIVRWP
jgi:uncharacterized membrane protein (UPF0127 family)